MKYGIKLSANDIAMIDNLSTLTEDKMKGILIDKGDIEMPDVTKYHNPIKWVPLMDFCWEEFDDSFEVHNGKSMKRADRRKRTYHKHQKRENQYRNLGYHLERFSKADLGKMKEGVGMFPETQHQYTMYNRGEKKMEKSISVLEAISLIEEQKRLDSEEAFKEYLEAERAFAKKCIRDMEREVERLTDVMFYTENSISELENNINELWNKFDKAYETRHNLLDKIKEMEEFVYSEK